MSSTAFRTCLTPTPNDPAGDQMAVLRTEVNYHHALGNPVVIHTHHRPLEGPKPILYAQRGCAVKLWLKNPVVGSPKCSGTGPGRAWVEVGWVLGAL